MLARLLTLLGLPIFAARIYHPITYAPPRPCSHPMPRISDYRPHPDVSPCPSFPIVPTIPTIPTIFCRASDTFANAGVYAQGVSSGLVGSRRECTLGRAGRIGGRDAAAALPTPALTRLEGLSEVDSVRFSHWTPGASGTPGLLGIVGIVGLSPRSRMAWVWWLAW